MLGIITEHRRIARPVFVELRWKLHEIARHRDTCKTWVLGIGEHAVERVAELVEHGNYVVEGEQDRLTVQGLVEVGDVINYRQGSEQLGTFHKFVHPGSAI